MSYEFADSTQAEWECHSGAVFTVDGIPLAYMDRKPGNGTMPVERDANAYLMAASRDLLLALQDARMELSQWHSHYHKKCEGGCPTLTYIAAADKAIGKAKGEL
jgi:hypothetical protein